MARRRRRSRRRLRTKGDEILGAFIALIIGYVIAEGVLQRSMHPLHWLLALAIAALGYIGVWLWYYWAQVCRDERARQDG